MIIRATRGRHATRACVRALFHDSYNARSLISARPTEAHSYIVGPGPTPVPLCVVRLWCSECMTVMTVEDPRIPPTLPRTVSCLCRRKACITTRHALLVKCRMVSPALVHTLVSKTARQPPTLVSMPAMRRTTAHGSYSLVSGEVGGSSHLVAHGCRPLVCLSSSRACGDDRMYALKLSFLGVEAQCSCRQRVSCVYFAQAVPAPLKDLAHFFSSPQSKPHSLVDIVVRSEFCNRENGQFASALAHI